MTCFPKGKHFCRRTKQGGTLLNLIQGPLFVIESDSMASKGFFAFRPSFYFKKRRCEPPRVFSDGGYDGIRSQPTIEKCCGVVAQKGGEL